MHGNHTELKSHWHPNGGDESNSVPPQGSQWKFWHITWDSTKPEVHSISASSRQQEVSRTSTSDWVLGHFTRYGLAANGGRSRRQGKMQWKVKGNGKLRSLMGPPASECCALLSENLSFVTNLVPTVRTNSKGSVEINKSDVNLSNKAKKSSARLTSNEPFVLVPDALRSRPRWTCFGMPDFFQISFHKRWLWHTLWQFTFECENQRIIYIATSCFGCCRETCADSITWVWEWCQRTCWTQLLSRGRKLFGHVRNELATTINKFPRGL